MVYTAVPDVVMNADAVKFISDYLGYPKYFVPFIGLAKIAGVIVILIPGLGRIKDWAYAGLLFDLVGATYSVIKVAGVDISLSFMILPMIFLFLSYYLWRKKTGTL